MHIESRKLYFNKMEERHYHNNICYKLFNVKQLFDIQLLWNEF